MGPFLRLVFQSGKCVWFAFIRPPTRFALLWYVCILADGSFVVLFSQGYLYYNVVWYQENELAICLYILPSACLLIHSFIVARRYIYNVYKSR